MDGPDVSLNGSPTVSPTTAAMGKGFAIGSAALTALRCSYLMQRQ